MHPRIFLGRAQWAKARDDDDANDDGLSKTNLYFSSEIHNWLDLFSTPMALKTSSG